MNIQAFELGMSLQSKIYTTVQALAQQVKIIPSPEYVTSLPVAGGQQPNVMLSETAFEIATEESEAITQDQADDAAAGLEGGVTMNTTAFGLGSGGSGNGQSGGTY